MSAFIEAKQAQAGALSLLVAQRVRNFFKIEKNRTEFEAWYAVIIAFYFGTQTAKAESSKDGE